MKDKQASKQGHGRCFGQDLMRGEHVVGENNNMLRSNALSSSNAMKYAGGFEGSDAGTSGTSIFDPVLCELIYRWFSPPGGVVLDPFAGGSVRGVVAAILGRAYHGVELRAEQVEANRDQWAEINKIEGRPVPSWRVGDSKNIREICANVKADLIFSCPPYADLEIYSDDPADISTFKYPEFIEAYREIISASVSLLRPDRFACFVVGEARGKDGNYYGFVPDTIKSFEGAGMRFYNEAILVTAVGSLPIRVGRQFAAGRKLGKTHQNVLVFLKGDSKKATAAMGEVGTKGFETLLNGNE